MEKLGFINEQQAADDLGIKKDRLAIFRVKYKLAHIQMGKLILYDIETLKSQLNELQVNKIKNDSLIT